MPLKYVKMYKNISKSVKMGQKRNKNGYSFKVDKGSVADLAKIS